jgi:hypothetical protein
MPAQPTVDTLTVADEPGLWRQVGFEVGDDGICAIGTVRVRLAARDAGRGIVGWSVRGLGTTDLDGLPTELSDTPPHESAPTHPNGVDSFDHVVAFTPDRARTAAALTAAGMDLRRLRDEPTPAGGGFQAFFRLGEVILEVVEYPSESPRAAQRDAPARFWGLALNVQSLGRATELLGDRLSEPRDAVQVDRQIATIRRAAGLAVPIALMTPGPGAA